MPLDASQAKTRRQALELVRTIVSANCCCDPDDFLREDTTLVEARLHPGRMPSHMGRPHLGLVTFGAGVVVTASAEWMGWIRGVVRGLARDEIFSMRCLGRIERHVLRSGQNLAGPHHRLVCCEDLWRSVPAPEGVELETIEAGPRMEPLYDLPFEFALGERGGTERPDMLATVARSGDRIVGLAGASADHAEMWQIGISVEETFRGRGIGSALVSTCARAILDSGQIVYYSTHLSNLRSQSIALRSGFVPTWTEAYVPVARPRRVPGDYLSLERDRT